MHILSLLLSLIQNFDTSEGKLRREFESYGPVKRVRGCISTRTCTYCIVLLNKIEYLQVHYFPIHTHNRLILCLILRMINQEVMLLLNTRMNGICTVSH